MSKDQMTEIASRVDVLRKAGKSAEADKVLTSILSELEKIPTNPRFLVKFGTKFENDFARDYELKEDVEPLEGDVLFEVASFPEDKKTSKLLANLLGQRDAEKIQKFLNSKEGAEVSKELRSFYLVFPGTLWKRRATGNHYVPILYWHGEQWYLNLRYLVNDWDARARFLVPRKS